MRPARSMMCVRSVETRLGRHDVEERVVAIRVDPSGLVHYAQETKKCAFLVSFDCAE